MAENQAAPAPTSPAVPTAVPMNPLHYQVALNEATLQLQLLSSRAQMLAVELHEARNLNGIIAAQLADEQAKNVGLLSKLEELEKGK